jgi:hypothetical protein
VGGVLVALERRPSSQVSQEVIGSCSGGCSGVQGWVAALCGAVEWSEHPFGK